MINTNNQDQKPGRSTDRGLEMADKLVTTQYDFLRSVVRSVDRSLGKPGAAKK